MYVIKYEYCSWEESCGCCTDYSSELSIYNENNLFVPLLDSDYAPLLEDVDELCDYIAEHYPEYRDFVVHEDTRWF